MRPACVQIFLLLGLAALAVRSWSQDLEHGELTPEGNRPVRDVPEPIAQRYGDLLRAFQPFSPRHAAELFPGHRFHEATVYHPGTAIAGPDRRFETVLEHEGSYRFVGGDAAACEFLSETGAQVPDVASAIARVLAFAELRRYSLRLQGPDPIIEQAMLLGWKMIAQERDDGWAISCVLLTDRHREGCDRYDFHVTAKGRILVERTTPVSGNGGYR